MKYHLQLNRFLRYFWLKVMNDEFPYPHHHSFIILYRDSGSKPTLDSILQNLRVFLFFFFSLSLKMWENPFKMCVLFPKKTEISREFRTNYFSLKRLCWGKETFFDFSNWISIFFRKKESKRDRKKKKHEQKK